MPDQGCAGPVAYIIRGAPSPRACNICPFNGCERNSGAGHNSCSIVSGDVSNCFVSTESTSCHEFASQFGLEFFYAKNTQNYRVACATVYLNEAPTGHSSPSEQAKRGINFVMVGRTPTHRKATTWTAMAVGVCVRACVRA